MGGPVVRRATTADVADIVVLFDIGARSLASYLWGLETGSGQSALEVARAEVLRESSGINLSRAWIAELDRQVAGLLMGYPYAETVDVTPLPPPLRPIVELENQTKGYWLINMLAVYPEFRGLGVGSRLLAKAEEQGRKVASSGIALIVDSFNEGAYRLYKRQGFRGADKMPVVPFPNHPDGGEFLLMKKPFP